MLKLGQRKYGLIVSALLVAFLAGCSTVEPVKPVGTATPAPGAAKAPATTQPEVKAPVPIAGTNFVGKVALAPNHGPVNTPFTVTGTGLPANAKLDVVWGTVSGGWDLRGEFSEEYHGQKYTPATQVLTTVTTDSNGEFNASVTAPVDYGFTHNVTVVSDGKTLNQSAFNIDMTATLQQTSGPPGSLITLDITGVGWKTYEATWIVFYDNKTVGWTSAVTSKGVARAQFPASGAPGKHIVTLMEGPFTNAYRAIETSPFPYLKPFNLEYIVTPGEAVMPLPPEQQQLPIERGKAPEGSGTAIWTDPVFAPVGTAATLQGRGLPAGKTVDFVWTAVKGERVTGGGWKLFNTSLGKAVVDDKGNASISFKVPDDLGGNHRIDAQIDGQTVTSTRLAISTTGRMAGPTSGPVGSDITIELKGVGWTETANIRTVDYDNSHIGYVCGFSTQGTVMMYLKATGEPGWHYIDFYPSIYKGEEPNGDIMFRVPQLTAAVDHPGEKVAPLRFAYLITP